jgi:hypothetical protein
MSSVIVVAPSSEDEMIATFLRAELDSDRFGQAIADALRRSGADVRVVTSPALANGDENELRRRILDETRGYSRREGLFAGFPTDVRWQRVALTRAELAAVRYINYDYWVELSGGTRRPADAAERIRAGVRVFGVPSDGFLDAAAALAAGAEWPELIIVSATAEGGDVVLEGHVRLTAFALAPSSVPTQIEVLRGVTPRFVHWWAYVREASKRGVFAYIVDGDAGELQSAIDITLQRFAEYQNLQGAGEGARRN